MLHNKFHFDVFTKTLVSVTKEKLSEKKKMFTLNHIGFLKYLSLQLQVRTHQISQKQQLMHAQRDESFRHPCLHRRSLPPLSPPQARHQLCRVHHDGQHHQVCWMLDQHNQPHDSLTHSIYKCGCFSCEDFTPPAWFLCSTRLESSFPL